MTKTLLIDCDPGQDDAIMLFLAFASPAEFNVAAITTVAGNVGLDLTQRNARIICDLAAQENIPVYAGHKEPLRRPLVTAEKVHGISGIDGIEIYEPNTPLQDQHAVDFIIEYLSNTSIPITLVCTGPLTNIASALQRQPSIADQLDEIVVMGGAMREAGNITPSAEFNFYVDPDAVKTVLACGRPITITSLDISHQALLTGEKLEQIRQLDSKPAQSTVAMLEHYNRYNGAKFSNRGSPLHDPCTIAYLLRPEIFKGKTCNVQIETESALTLGHSAVDYWHTTDKVRNVNWLHEIDEVGFCDLIIERLSQY